MYGAANPIPRSSRYPLVSKFSKSKPTNRGSVEFAARRALLRSHAPRFNRCAMVMPHMRQRICNRPLEQLFGGSPKGGIRSQVASNRSSTAKKRFKTGGLKLIEQFGLGQAALGRGRGRA